MKTFSIKLKVVGTGTVTVEAETEEQAINMVDDIPRTQISMDTYFDGVESIDEIEN